MEGREGSENPKNYLKKFEDGPHNTVKIYYKIVTPFIGSLAIRL